MAAGKFATAINCIDGRTQRPVSEWIRIQFAIDYVDTITHPGPEKALSISASIAAYRGGGSPSVRRKSGVG